MSWSSEPYFPARCLVSVLSFSCWLLSFNTPSRPADNCRMTNSFRIKFCNIFDRSGVLSVMWDASRSPLWRTFLFLSSDVSEWQWWSLCCCCCRGVSLYISFSFLFFLLFKTQLMFSIVPKKKTFFFSASIILSARSLSAAWCLTSIWFHFVYFLWSVTCVLNLLADIRMSHRQKDRSYVVEGDVIFTFSHDAGNLM